MEPLTLAAYVIQYCINRGTPISNLQLQKILYFIQLQSIRRTGNLIMPKAIFEAWRFGPVIPEVYSVYCLFGAYPIESVIANTAQSDMVFTNTNYIDQVIDECLRREPWELVALSHRANGAWEKANNVGWRTIIRNEDIIAEAQNFNLLEN